MRPFGGVTDDDIRNEFRALDKICTRAALNIVQVWRHDSLRHSGFSFIDMELCDLNLEDYIQRKWPLRLSQTNFLDFPSNYRTIISDIMIDIASGLGFIHGLQEVHRDLKPRNGLPIFVHC